MPRDFAPACTPDMFLAGSVTDRRRWVLDMLDRFPERHVQHVWINHEYPCGTAACVAGWTALLAGYDLARDDAGDLQEDLVALPGCQGQDVADLAAELLGFGTGDYESHPEFRGLFYLHADDAREHLRHLVWGPACTCQTGRGFEGCPAHDP